MSTYTDFLQGVALQVHELIQDPKQRERFQEGLRRFHECCEKEDRDAKDNADKEPKLRDQKAGLPGTGYEWHCDDRTKKSGYWRPPGLWKWIFFDMHDLPALTDSVKKTLLDYAVLATVHDKALPSEVPIGPDGWHEKWGDAIWSVFEDEWQADHKANKRAWVMATLANVRTDLQGPRIPLMDGPYRPCNFAWAGQSYALPPIQWRILKFMWDKDEAAIEKVEEHVWGHDVTGNNFNQAVNRLDGFMSKHNLPFNFSVKNGSVVKECR